MREKPLILVIDDLESNLQVAGNILVEAGYEISLSIDGRKGLEIAKRTIPDLILLDLVMPNIDGFEVCRQLKSQSETTEIPVIFLTSMKNTDNVIKGFELGAVDYIIKPANKQETLARVKTHLDLKRSKETILMQNKQLKNLIEERNGFFTISSNHLMNPLNLIKGYNDLIKIFDSKNTNSSDLKRLTQQIDSEIKAVSSIVNDFLYLYNLEEGNFPSIAESFNINMLIGKVIKDFEADIKAKRLIVEHETDLSKTTHALAVKEKMEVVFKHLISNAIKYSSFYRSISITSTEIFDRKKFIRVEIKDQGVGMNEEDLKNIFNKYAQLSPTPTNNEQTVGLGMATVKKLVDEMGVQIQIESQESYGTMVKLLVPTM
ncbi:MAG: response regulator [Ignavibacteria bacterium]|nr:response regulator [Ignavibacteria bacterium]